MPKITGFPELLWSELLWSDMSIPLKEWLPSRNDKRSPVAIGRTDDSCAAADLVAPPLTTYGKVLNVTPRDRP